MDAFERVCSRPIISKADELLQVNAADVYYRVDQKYVSCNLSALEKFEPDAEEYFFMSKMNAF